MIRHKCCTFFRLVTLTTTAMAWTICTLHIYHTFVPYRTPHGIYTIQVVMCNLITPVEKAFSMNVICRRKALVLLIQIISTIGVFARTRSKTLIANLRPSWRRCTTRSGLSGGSAALRGLRALCLRTRLLSSMFEGLRPHQSERRTGMVRYCKVNYKCLIWYGIVL